MKRNTLATLLGLALITAPAAHAEGLSYTYVEARVAHTQIDVFGPSELTANGTGGGVAGSVAFGRTGLFATASYDTVDADAADVSLDRSSLGLGYAVAIDETLHLVFDAKGLRIKGDDGFGSASENGYQATVGLRSLVADNVEASIKGGVIRVDNDDVEIYDGAIVEVGARWHMDGMWSVGIDGSFTKDERTAMLGFRAQW